MCYWPSLMTYCRPGILHSSSSSFMMSRQLTNCYSSLCHLKVQADVNHGMTKHFIRKSPQTYSPIDLQRRKSTGSRCPWQPKGLEVHKPKNEIKRRIQGSTPIT